MIRLLLAVPLLTVLATSAQARDCTHLFLNGRPPALTAAQPGDRKGICFLAYAALVSGAARDPIWSAEHLTARYAKRAPHARRSGSFHPEQRLPADARAYPRDYDHGWDRGHMTPARDIATRRAKDETFSMANIVPQAPALNRGVWEGIESAVRHLAAREGELYIVTGPILRPDDRRTENGRVEIPSATWKAIYNPATSTGGAWICTNTMSPDCRTVSIATLSQQVGVDPFPSLSRTEAARSPELPAPEPSR
jgi:endonuclease G